MPKPNLGVTSRTTANCPALFAAIPSSLICGENILIKKIKKY